MEPVVFLLLGLLVGGGAGGYAGWTTHRKKFTAQKSEYETEAKRRGDRILADAEKDAEAIQKSAELEARQKQIEAQKELEDLHRQQRAELNRLEERLSKREDNLDKRASSLDQKADELEKREVDIQRRTQSLTDREKNLDDKHASIDKRLEEVARLSREQARREIVDSVTEEAKLSAAKVVRQLEEEAINEAERRAKKIISVAVQRYAGEFVTERCVSVVNLPNDDMKGRIIGREGRNIRAIEAATGVDLIVDDTPEAVILSGFDPVRREIARLSLERLIADGRIHPSRIEEVVAKTRKEIDKVVREAGEQAAFELGITDLHSEIVRTLGRLRYRTSYGQNQWSHSIEVGFLSGLMASELGLSTKIARRCGLLHDIGKALDHDQEGSHAIIGANLIKKHGEKDIVVNAVASHHDEVKPTSVFAHLVMAADALSGARPGARREVLESYVKRLEELEAISRSFKGVSNCFAIQAGREIRVMVENERVNDDQALILSKDIARKIEEELVYPGQIKVTVIRETRAVEYAR